ncbi:uncharacterized protein LOC112462679 [Temnothorax curvispinosus]|uniref:Uncharacterized protein LOC112462679 n=1 Tax=Temnothorax curvispinosus TaxID=300111 RepID=A0A6J1QPD2_9HYME|nr:uncharacterized protein LOC112462679 [Temnothorax curvispinosus]
MEPKEKYNVRMLRGKMKGKLAKIKVVNARENNYAATIQRREKTCASEVQNNSPECLHAEDSLGSRRIVNLKVFGQQLWCLSCNIALSINNAVSEKNFGLASIFKVKCSQCGRLRTVNTDDKLPGNEGFIVNTKAAFGMIDAGIGPTHLNT